MNGAKVSYVGPVPTGYTWNINDDRITLRLTKVNQFIKSCLFACLRSRSFKNVKMICYPSTTYSS